MTSKSGLANVIGIAALALFLVGSFVGLFVVPADGMQGDIQRLMYVHVPAAWLAFLSFFVVFLMSVLYLIQRDLRWDRVAQSSAEIGVVFTVLTLALGSMWGKPTWGVWWTWDPRLTTTAIMLAIYVGYLAIRSFADDPDKRARWAAIVGIIGFANVPIVYLSVIWWRTLHQPPSSPRSVSPEILWTLMFNLAAFSVIYVYLMMRRIRLAKLEGELEQRMAYHG
ncbi:MAG: cytochrome c biogenesis protein CcsA [Gemmatimonadetes bacterium]|nr:cytochrome c biogenesis protein CcsA [Gemmatimonadota bacterium]